MNRPSFSKAWRGAFCAALPLRPTGRAAIIGAVAFTHRFRKFGDVCLVIVTAGVGLSLAPPRGRAEGPSAVPIWYTPLGETPAHRAQAEYAAQRWAEADGLVMRAADSVPDDEVPVMDAAPEQLAVLTQAEQALQEARALNAELREAAALRVLAQAEETLLGALEVPGVHAFLAEVYVQLALCAAQLGEIGLFETAFARALSLDPHRRLEAAEAPPALVERARELGHAQDVAASSELLLSTEPKAARGWLDSVALESGSLATRVRPGMHVLLVRAAGHAPYATLLKLEPGRRAPLRVVLSPLAREQARRRLQAAHDVAGARPAASAFSRLVEAPVLLFEPTTGELERVLIHRCDSAGCQVLEGRESGTSRPARFAKEGAAYAWLNAKAVSGVPREERPFWKRWPLWTAAGLVVVGGVTAAIWATRPAAVREQRELTLDPVALPR